MNKQILWEAVKEPLRLLVLSLVSVGIAYFTDLDWEYAPLLLLGLRLVDSVMHEMGKERSTKTEESKLLKGLVRF